MILFCEDCGEKNDLDATAFVGGKAVFKCHVCGYPNAYAFHCSEADPVDPASLFFDEIQSASNIVGGVLYHKKKGIIEHRMPAVLARGDVEALGARLTITYDRGRQACPDLSKMTVVISDKYFSVFSIGTDCWAIVVASKPGLPDRLLELISGIEQGNL